MRVWMRAIEGALWGIVAPVLLLAPLSLLGHDGLSAALDGDPSLYLELWLLTAVPLALYGAWAGEREARLCAANAQLDELAITDPLTGLRNVRYFSARLAEAWARHRREGAPVALAVIDLDRFKAVNDRYGHAAGDRVLAAAACAIDGVCRRGETAARIGGEEFAVILPGADLAAAERVAERIRRAIARERITVPGVSAPLAVTASVGIASTRGARLRTPDELFRAADAAVYDAKAKGRDRTSAGPRAPAACGPATPPQPASSEFHSVAKISL